MGQKSVRNKLTLTSFRGGFTLIELLVAIVILGILTVIASSNFVSTQKKARDARRKEDLTNIARALEAYYNDRGQYPAGSTEGKIMACGPVSSPVVCDWGDPMQDDRDTLYMPQIPVDPQELEYYYVSSGNAYELYARLENDKDPAIAMFNPGERIVGAYEGTDCGVNGCNFGIASSNWSLANIVEDY